MPELAAPLARFGKFEVLGLLGRGGMAEVHLCRLGGIGGFAKQLVVKRILPERTRDPTFLTMFLDEARLASHLSHPNIVQVFEIDEVNGTPYIAMEYVRGPTFATIIAEANRARQIHMGHMAKIVAGVCAGLEHAHVASGPQGPLGIIHRDVSPQNVLVSPEGIPKVLDFGVAKAHDRNSTTQSGALKGKLKYMAPERLRHGTIDHRADVFSAGVCLCEATTGHNPFGPRQISEVQLFRNILDGRFTAPSALALNYPPALDQIVRWAIEPDMHKRCPTAEALHDALEDFVASGPHASDERALATWIHELVPSRLFAEPVFEKPKGQRAPAAESTPTFEMHDTIVTPHTVAIPPTLAIELAARALAPPLRRSWRKPILAVAAVVAIASGSLAAIRLKPKAPPLAPPVAAKPAPPPAPAFSPDRAARTYLDEAERFARTNHLGSALDMLAKARELPITDPQLNIRLARVRDDVETTASLRQAETLIATGESQKAQEIAKQVLDRTPDDMRAMQVLMAARKASAPPPPPEPPPPAVATKKKGGKPIKKKVAMVRRTPARAKSPPPAPAPAPSPPPVAVAAVTPPPPDLAARPKGRVPPPRLPRSYEPKDGEDLARVCRMVESEAIFRAGVSASFASGLTQPLASGPPRRQIYPVGMYYFIVAEAARGRDTKSVSQALANQTDIIQRLASLPAADH